MPSGSPDYGAVGAVTIAGDALARVAVGSDVGRNTEPGADLVACPSVGIEPAAPWAAFPKIGRREIRVAWRVRLIVSRWGQAPALAMALDTYRQAAPDLRLSGYDVAPLDAPTVARIGGLEYLLATFTVFATFKE
jgi:hypothetical protein